jgi:hypothetical protein
MTEVIKNVRGSKDIAIPLIVGKTTVYVKSNIHKVEFVENDPEAIDDLWEWDEIQYTKDEFILLMASNIDYLSVMLGVDLNV